MINKANLKRLPFMAHPPSYDDSSNELAFVVPIFSDSTVDAYLYYYVPAGLAVARSVILNTDVVNRRIPVFLFIEDCIFEVWREVLSRLGVPRNRIRIFNNLPAGRPRYRRVSKRLYAMKDPVLNKYENIILLDCDEFACRKPGITEPLKTDYLQGDTVAVAFKRVNPPHEPLWHNCPYWFQKWNAVGTTEEHFERSEAELKKVRPDLSLKEKVEYVIHDCNFMRFPRQMPKEFVNFIFELEPVLGDEEAIFALWSTLLGGHIDVLDPEPHIFHAENIYNHRDHTAYWAHFNQNDRVMSQLEADWRTDIGIYPDAVATGHNEQTQFDSTDTGSPKLTQHVDMSEPTKSIRS